MSNEDELDFVFVPHPTDPDHIFADSSTIRTRHAWTWDQGEYKYLPTPTTLGSWWWLDEKWGFNVSLTRVSDKPVIFAIKAKCPVCLRDFGRDDVKGTTSDKDRSQLYFKLGVLLSWHMAKEHGVEYDGELI